MILFFINMMQRPKPDPNSVELLAPAGSADTARAAIAAGADAVYIGGTRFGARAYADNPEQDSLLEVLDEIHLQDKKMYLTINTLLKEKELEEELYTYLAPYYEAGLDAVIVQDPGVMQFVLREFPDMAVHASTQMTITGPLAAKMLEQMGVTRVVTARELSLKEIRAIREATELEIESFVHGALCYCYSGRCLLSSMIGGRSGNRGRCAQPCRLPYSVYDAQKQKLNGRDEQYMLSPKDMCTVDILPEILQAGVNSLKIEGRMKKPEYTAGVVSIYRKYLDQYLSGRFHGVTKEDHQILFDLYNRDGFHESYYRQHNGKHMMALKNEKLTKTARDRNEALFADIHGRYCETVPELDVTGLASFCVGEPMSLWLQHGETSAYVTGAEVQTAKNQPMDAEKVKKQLQKTGDSGFAFTDLSVETAGAAFAPVKEINALRREGLAALKTALLQPYRRMGRDLAETDRASEETDARKNDIDRIGSSTAELTVLVQTKEQLQAVLAVAEHPDRIYVEYTLWLEEPDWLREQMKIQSGIFWMLALPQMLREEHRETFVRMLPELEKTDVAGYLVRTMEELCILLEQKTEKELCLDDCMYTMNSEALSFYRMLGVERFTAPAELNRRELALRPQTDSELCIYGRQILMISAQCLRKNTTGCDRKSGTLTLKDRKGIEFPAKCCCKFCYNILYNSVPLGLVREAAALKEAGYRGLRLSFTTETKEETAKILQVFADALHGHVPQELPAFTRGHYQRGVE